MDTLPTAKDVDAAADRIAGLVVKTPLLRCSELDNATGGTILLKAENVQKTGSFKLRGAMNHLVQMSPELRAQGVLAWSSGNHAQGVAAAAYHFGVSAKIVMPADAPKSKITATADLGAEIVFYGRGHENREEIGTQIAQEEGRTIIPPYDHVDTICGQGTVGLEILEQLATQDMSLEDILIPVSGGGLAAGVGLALKAQQPDINIYAVEPKEFDDHKKSLNSGRQVSNSRTTGSVCDALLAPTPGEMTWHLNQRQLSDGYTVSDSQALEAMAFAHRVLGLRLEPSGAAALAAVLSGQHPSTGRCVCVILSGGNVDQDTFNRALDHQPVEP